MTHVFLGYRWSHNESASNLRASWVDNDRQGFRSSLQMGKQALNESACSEKCFLLFREQEKTLAGILSRWGEVL
jgi:hypothetical protein